MSTVPPTIIDKETSTDIVVREASNVTLTCRASGYPEPYVMWRREDGEDINYNGETGKHFLIINLWLHLRSIFREMSTWYDSIWEKFLRRRRDKKNN